MPIIRYRTGDRGKWIEPSCDCAHGAPLLKLLGRIDNVILIWGLRILYDQLVAAVDELGISYTAIQVLAYAQDCEQYLHVKVESQLTFNATIETQLRNSSYECCGDIKETVEREMLDSHLFFEFVPIGSLQRSARTGKVIPIIDTRD